MRYLVGTFEATEAIGKQNFRTLFDFSLGLGGDNCFGRRVASRSLLTVAEAEGTLARAG